MTVGLEQVIENLKNGSNRLDVKPYLFSKFVGGSPDEAFIAIERQMNEILDEYEGFLTNALEEIINLHKAHYRAIKILSEERCTCTCRKEKGSLHKNTR